MKFCTHGFERVSVLDVLRNEAGVQDGLLHLLSEAAVDGGAEVVPTRVVLAGRRRQHQRRRQRRQAGGVEGHALVAHPARDVVLAGTVALLLELELGVVQTRVLRARRRRNHRLRIVVQLRTLDEQNLKSN